MIFHGGHTHLRMLLPEDLCNRSPGFSTLVIQEEAPSPLPVSGPMYGLPKLTIQHRAVVDPGYCILLLLSSNGGSALPGCPFRLDIPHQARMDTLLPEVHPPGDPRPDLLGPVDAQRLCKNDLVEDKGSLRVPTPVNYPLPFHGQDGRKAAPHCSCGYGIPASQLGGYPAPTTLPDSVVRNSPIQVRHIAVVGGVSIDLPQQQVRRFRGKVR